MIFKTFDSDKDTFSSKFGIFGKSFEDIGNRFKKVSNELIETNDYTISNIVNAWKNSSIKKDLSDKFIITKSDIQNKLKDLSVYDQDPSNILASLLNNKEKIETGQKTWQDYFNCLKEGEKWQVKFVQENDLTKVSLDDVKNAQNAAKQSAIAYNNGLEQMTIGAKAANIALEGLKMAANMIAGMLIAEGIQLAITAIDNWIHRVEKANEAMDKATSEYASAKSVLEETTSQLNEQNKRIDELNKKDKLTYVEQEELDKLKEATRQLELQKNIEEKEKANSAREAADKTVTAFNKQYGKGDIDKNAVDTQLAQSKATSTSSSSGKNVKKIKGVSSKTLDHYKKLIREGTLGSDGIASIKNENLKNALKDYQVYYEKAKACKEQVASLTDQLKDLYETLANNPIDSASDKIEKLGTKIDILNAKVGNLTFDPTKKIGTSDIDGLYKQIIKNYNSQLSASKTAYTGATKSYKSNKSSLTKSLKKTKAKNIGLTQKEFNSIKSNLKSNKSISYNLINKIENDTLREKCIAHNEYLLAKNTATDNYNQAKEDYTSNVRQARKDRFDKVQARYDNKAGLIEQRKNSVSNSLNIAEAKGQLIGEAYYARQANAVKSDMKLKQEEAGKLAKKLSTIKFGSNEWYEAQEALNGVYEAIQQDEQELAEFQKSINELKFDRFNELLNKLGDITDETDFLVDMLDSDNLFDSNTGMITQDGITAIGLTAQNYDTCIILKSIL